MIEIVKTKQPANIVEFKDWKYNKNSVVLAKHSDSYYMMFYSMDLGWIFKNVENHTLGANGHYATPEKLVEDFMSFLVRIWEFDSVAEAMKFIDNDAPRE